jgi:hypothetical protein
MAWSHVNKVVHMMMVGKQKERGKSQWVLQGLSPSNLLSANRSHLLRALPLPNSFISLRLSLKHMSFELRASGLQSRHSISWATPPIHFTLAVLEMGSHELFAQVGL